MPLLVQLLGGNPATAAGVLSCLNTVDATTLRSVHPVLAAVVAGVPWVDATTGVWDVVRWRAALPAAVSVKVAWLPVDGGGVGAALAGVASLDLGGCLNVTDAVVACLPPSLHALKVDFCADLTEDASFVHLAALTTLDCSDTDVGMAGLGGLPPSLRELRICLDGESPQETRLATVAELPASMETEHSSRCSDCRAAKLAAAVPCGAAPVFPQPDWLCLVAACRYISGAPAAAAHVACPRL